MLALWCSTLLMPTSPSHLPDFGETHRYCLRQCAVSIALIDEKTGDGVRVMIDKKTGRAGMAGRGELLNWFCDQMPHFRGLLGNSLPNGRYIYARIPNTQLDEYAPISRSRKCHSTTASLKNVRKS